MTSSSAALGAAIFAEVLAYWFGIRCVCAIKVVCPLKRNGGIPAMRLPNVAVYGQGIGQIASWRAA